MSIDGCGPGYLRHLDPAEFARELAAVTISRSKLRSGRVTVIYNFGPKDAPPVVVLPPTGMSFLLVSRLALSLSANFHVITWESRGCPDTDVSFADADSELDSQAADFANIIAAKDIHNFHFVGWCQAAQIVIAACATNDAVTPLSLSLVAAAGLGYSANPSEFERCALPIYLQIAARDIAYAGEMGALLGSAATGTGTQADVVSRLTRLHLSSAEATFRFSRYMRAFEDNKHLVRSAVGGVLERVRTQLIHCRDDSFSHYSESIELARSHSNIELTLLPAGGHLCVFNEPQLIADLAKRFATSGSA